MRQDAEPSRERPKRHPDRAPKARVEGDGRRETGGGSASGRGRGEWRGTGDGRGEGGAVIPTERRRCEWRGTGDGRRETGEGSRHPDRAPKARVEGSAFQGMRATAHQCLV